MATVLPSLLQLEPTELDIVLWPDEVLSTVCDPVEEDEFGMQLEAIGNRMLQLIAMPNEKGHAPRGIGLAAPQVGVTKRMFVMTVAGFDAEGKNYNRSNRKPIIAVNPIVEPFGPRTPHQEGCLSTPGTESQVIRPYNALLKYQHPVTAEWNEIELHDYDAFCAGHEYDHLDGIMYFDTRRMDKNLSKRLLKEYYRQRGL